MLVEYLFSFSPIACASTCNVVLMRNSELHEGIEVFDENEKVIGTSLVAAKKVGLIRIPRKSGQGLSHGVVVRVLHCRSRLHWFKPSLLHHWKFLAVVDLLLYQRAIHSQTMSISV